MLSGCTKLFFFPHATQLSVPSDYGYNYTDITLTTPDDIQLNAWLMDAGNEPIGVVYFLHGNAENISTHSQAVHWLLDSGYQIFALDYRGYGRSTGNPALPELFTDIDTGMTWLTKHMEQAGLRDSKYSTADIPLFMLGQSLGASLAVKYLQMYPSQRDRLDGIILEAAFTRYGAIARHVANSHWLTWSFQLFAQYLMPKRYDPIDAIASVTRIPLLMIHSKDDTIVPFWQGPTTIRCSQPAQNVFTNQRAAYCRVSG